VLGPDEIRLRAEKFYSKQKLLRSYFTGEDFFPLTISLQKPSSSKLVDDFPYFRQLFVCLHQQSKASKGFGFKLECESLSHRQLGNQQIPVHAVFYTQEDLLAYLGKKKEFSKWIKLIEQVIIEFPALKEVMANKPSLVTDNFDLWPQWINVCRFFINNPKPNLFMRQLEIPGVDSKFIETNKKSLQMLLSAILPHDSVNKEIINLSEHGFERRFGLQFELPRIRFRLLDQNLSYSLADLKDVEIPLSSFNQLQLPCKNIIITENKINGLVIPALQETIVIFGLGYGLGILNDIPWLKDKRIGYWGDIDTHGFAILSQLRSYLPHAESLLMDVHTLTSHSNLWVKEKKPTAGQLPNLTEDEKKLYKELNQSYWGQRVRLEQERIPYSFCLQRIKNWVEKGS